MLILRNLVDTCSLSSNLLHLVCNKLFHGHILFSLASFLRFEVEGEDKLWMIQEAIVNKWVLDYWDHDIFNFLLLCLLARHFGIFSLLYPFELLHEIFLKRVLASLLQHWRFVVKWI